MKTTTATLFLALAAAAVGPSSAIARASIYVSNSGSHTIGKYNLDGTAVNAAFISGLNGPRGIALSEDGTSLFVANRDTGTVGQYDAATGAAVNAALISGLGVIEGITVSGSSLYVTDTSSLLIGKYTTSGATVNPALVTGLNGGPTSIVVSKDGTSLFVASGTSVAFVGQYDAATGAAVSAELISGFHLSEVALSDDGISLYFVDRGRSALGRYETDSGAQIDTLINFVVEPRIAVVGSRLFITNFNDGTVGQYDADTGAAVNAALVSGLPWASS